jgi:hypothetical protein
MAKDTDFDYKAYTNKALDAHGKWAKAVNKMPSYNTMVEFTGWLGDPFPREGVPATEILINVYNPEVRRQLDMLTGPHAETMMKVFLVRRKVST